MSANGKRSQGCWTTHLHSPAHRINTTCAKLGATDNCVTSYNLICNSKNLFK